jgi:hypothetical protein
MLGTSTSEVIPGLTQYIWLRLLGPERITFIALEYGTFPGRQVEDATVAENWLHAYGEPGWTAETARAIRIEMRRVYYPDTPDWQEMVLARSRQVVRQTLAGLSAS